MILEARKNFLRYKNYHKKYHKQSQKKKRQAIDKYNTYNK